MDNEKKSGNVFFAYELLHSIKEKDFYYLQLYNRVKIEVDWMIAYIETFHRKYAIITTDVIENDVVIEIPAKKVA
jgi:hypothetical protein